MDTVGEIGEEAHPRREKFFWEPCWVFLNMENRLFEIIFKTKS